jgi:hypothetical protein
MASAKCSEKIAKTLKNGNHLDGLQAVKVQAMAYAMRIEKSVRREA